MDKTAKMRDEFGHPVHCIYTYIYIYNIHTCYFSSNKKKSVSVRVINVETEIEREGMMVCRKKDDINIHI